MPSHQGRRIRLQPANAALLTGRGRSWKEVLSGKMYLDLVEVLLPSPSPDAAAPGSVPSLA